MRVASIAAGGLIIAAAWAYALRWRASVTVEASNAGSLEQSFTGAVDLVMDTVDAAMEGYLMPVAFNLSDQNLKAFLRMIRYCEGTSGSDGYRTIFGGQLFSGYEDHPRITVTSGSYTSTAAGAYQILSRTWDECKAALNLPDFSPDSQDRAAAFLIRRRGALEDIYAGRLFDAVRKCGKEWASLPGSPYGQPVKSLDQVKYSYQEAGGRLAGGVVYA